MMQQSSLKMEVIGVGTATRDRLMRVVGFPSEEGVTEVLAEVVDGGGPVATALCVMARLGRRCLLVDQVGDDVAGREILGGLSEHGVMLDGMKVVPGARSAEATVLVRGGDGARHILYRPSTVEEMSGEEIRREWMQGARLLHVNGRHEAVARRAVALARELGVAVSFDGGAGRYRDSIRDLVQASSVVIVARGFAEAFTGEATVAGQMEVFWKETEAVVVAITEGERGSWVAARGGCLFHQPAVRVENLVDTTGCGDVYHGAFLHGWLEQWELQRCAAFASEWAAATVEGLGGRWALRAVPG
jgi:sulfofructose kinase